MKPHAACYNPCESYPPEAVAPEPARPLAQKLPALSGQVIPIAPEGATPKPLGVGGVAPPKPVGISSWSR